MKTKLINSFFIIFISILTLTSCASKKDVIYFNDLNTSINDTTKFIAGKTQVNDILNILISTNSQDLTPLYNINQNTAPLTGYLVTPEGTITLPVIGKIKVLGLTLLEIENLLTNKLIEGKQIVNPIVIVRLINAKFTVLGEVNKPGTYTFNEENISLLQALGYAGDLTINGKRNNVLIIRQENGTMSYTKINLNSKNWFNSQNYYIKPNDIIYVNPNGPKIKSAGYIGDIRNFISIITTTISTFLTIIVLSK